MPPEEKDRYLENYRRPSKLRPEQGINIVDTPEQRQHGAREPRAAAQTRYPDIFQKGGFSKWDLPHILL